jgi:hypothetical protein
MHAKQAAAPIYVARHKTHTKKKLGQVAAKKSALSPA